jgi:hypothetical protein
MVRRIVAIWFRTYITKPDPTLGSRIIEKELPSLIRRFATKYLMAAKQNVANSFWNWCPDELRVAQKEVGIATSHVRSFLALTEDDEEACDGFGQCLYTQRVEGVETSIKSLNTAFAEYMKHESRRNVRTSEKIDKGTMQANNFEVKTNVNVCRACGRNAKKCCTAYSSKERTKRDVVVGLTIVRKTRMVFDAVDDDGLDGL